METDLERFEELKRMYEEEVKPNIAGKEYADAWLGMNKLVQSTILEERGKEIMRTYHHGHNLVTSARELEKELFKEEVSESTIEKEVKKFEAYMAQLDLAIKNGRKF